MVSTYPDQNTNHTPSGGRAPPPTFMDTALAASRFGARSESDRDGGFVFAVAEDGEDLESGAEVAAWGREFHVLAAFELRYGRLADAKFGGQVGLGALRRATQLVEADLVEGDRGR